jgi:uncharacterized protein YecE (DUF72 family)
MATIYIGCCGFPFSRKKYFSEYRTVEVQQTFYEPPDKSTLERWRQEAPQDFIYNIKAWQVITHTSRSPTWKKIRKRELHGDLSNYGLLRLTEENKWGWHVTVEAAEALNARVIVVQTPSSFGYSKENAENAKKFFAWALQQTGKKFVIGWEPRGSWHEKALAISDVVCSTGVVHIVDLLRRDPVVCEGQRVLYFRLHGLGGKEVNYRYKYTDEDLEQLASKISELISRYDSVEEVYVMFNNVYMAYDSKRFRELALKKGINVV